MLKKILVCCAVIVITNSCTYASYPDFAQMYVGKDKFENFNRKMFNFNMKLNKYALRPIHIIWTSVMPQCCINRIQSAYNNLEYPKRAISCLIQKDLKSSGSETVRFLTNTTLGIGGLFDPADKIFHIKQVDENMEQALTHCNVKQGPYTVVPIIPPSSIRGLTGKILDTALNPTTYVASPVLALVKAGFTVNNAVPFQKLLNMMESNYTDPYDIAKKFYGVYSHIQNTNLDRPSVLQEKIELVNNPFKNTEDDTISVSDIIRGEASVENAVLKSYSDDKTKLLADEVLFDYNPQCPVVDAMRTVLLDIHEKSIWAETSLWNRTFEKKLKNGYIAFTPDRAKYNYKYILQRDKTAPLAIIYPSIAENVKCSHNIVFAKLFYDSGYSVLLLGSNFHGEFVKSMPQDYRPGIPTEDVKYLKQLTCDIVNTLKNNYNVTPSKNIVFGTSFGAISALFLADSEAKENLLGNTKFIAVCPPVELIYAMKQVDKMAECPDCENLKEKTSVTVAKVLSAFNNNKDFNSVSFSEDEGKLITGFIMHQKLSDLIFTIENKSKCKKCCDFYKDVNDVTYQSYAQKYLLNYADNDFDVLNSKTSLHVISDYLKHADNYKIYHSVNDYLTNPKQLKQLKQYTGKNTVLFDNGSHLGFMYRDEFLKSLKKDIEN